MVRLVTFLRKYWITILIYIGIILGYKYIADTKSFNAFLFPPTGEIAAAFLKDWKTLFINMLYSFQLMIPSIVIAVAIALALGTLMGMHKKFREVIHPVIYSISVIPAILMSPFALLIAPNFRAASLFLVVYNTI